MKPLSVGGQAVVEGVMMRSPDKYSVSVRLPNGKIKSMVEKKQSWGKKYPWLDIPFARGAIFLIDMMIVGLKALSWSANQQQEEDEQLKSSEIAITMIVAFAFAILLFIGVPYVLARLISDPSSFLFHAIDGAVRLVIFISYLVLIGRMSDIKRIFQYHGAEHKAVHCLESGKKLTIKNVQTFPTEHPRCGTTMLVLVVLVSIIVFSLVRSQFWYWNIAFRIILVPVIAGISYEILRLGGKYNNWFMRSIITPGLWAQGLTTSQPDDKQVEVAIAALKKAL